MKYPPNIRLIRLMCSGRLDPTFVLQGLRQRRGWRVDHRLSSRRMSLHRAELQGPAALSCCCSGRLAQLGIEPQRVKLVWASAAEGAKLAHEITDDGRRSSRAWATALGQVPNGQAAIRSGTAAL